MKTLIISSSLSEDSKSYILCQKVNTELLKKGIKSEIVDARLVTLLPFHITKSKEMEELSNKISKSDNYIIGMGIHNYSISDSLKIILITVLKMLTKIFWYCLRRRRRKKLLVNYSLISNMYESMENDSVTKNYLCFKE